VADFVKGKVATMVEWMLRNSASGESLATYLSEAGKLLQAEDLRETVRKAVVRFLRNPACNLEHYVAHLVREWQAPLRKLGLDVEGLMREAGVSVKPARQSAGLKV